MFYTQEIIADIFKFAGESVTLINRDANFAAYIERTATGHTEQMWKDTIKRNVDHLEIIKAYKKEDETTSIWTSEDFTAVDAAVTSGKSKIAAL